MQESKPPSEEKHLLRAIVVISLVVIGFIFLPLYGMAWPFHHWRLYTVIQQDVPETVAHYQIVIESDPPQTVYSYDLMTIDDIGSGQVLGSRVMSGSVNMRDGENPYRDFLEKHLIDMGYGEYPARFQRCTLTIDHDDIFNPVQQTTCADIYTLFGR